MGQIVMTFRSENEAQHMVEKLSNAGVGAVMMRVLQSGGDSDHPKTDSTAPMVTPDMGAVEVRPDDDRQQSGIIPVTGEGVQVMIEFDDAYESQVQTILRKDV